VELQHRLQANRMPAQGPPELRATERLGYLRPGLSVLGSPALKALETLLAVSCVHQPWAKAWGFLLQGQLLPSPMTSSRPHSKSLNNTFYLRSGIKLNKLSERL